MRYLLDSSVLIDLINDRRGRRALIASLVRRGDIFQTTAINVAEVFAGMRVNEEFNTTAVLAKFDSFDITSRVARKGGTIKSFWSTKGKTLELPDCLVAAVAIEEELVLMTDNHRHFPMPELVLFDWPKA